MQFELKQWQFTCSIDTSLLAHFTISRFDKASFPFILAMACSALYKHRRIKVYDFHVNDPVQYIVQFFFSQCIGKNFPIIDHRNYPSDPPGKFFLDLHML